MNKKMNLQLFDGTANMAATTDTGLAAEIKEYYIKELLENAKPKLVHGQFGQKKPNPRGSGKVADWRKFSNLPKLHDYLNECTCKCLYIFIYGRAFRQE